MIANVKEIDNNNNNNNNNLVNQLSFNSYWILKMFSIVLNKETKSLIKIISKLFLEISYVNSYIN